MRSPNLLWAGVAALFVTFTVLAEIVFGGLLKSMPRAPEIGGQFSLTTHDGKRLSSTDLKGTPFVIFFGFTFCPGTCPTTMLELSNVLKRLGSDADKMRYLFVSVDHERDTPEQLKLYLSNFDSRIVGLTGTAQEIAAATKGYHVYYKKIATKEGFTYNHTPLIYLMGRNGRLVNKLKYLENEEIQVEKFRKFIALR